MVQDENGFARVAFRTQGEALDDLEGKGGDVRMRAAEKGPRRSLDPRIVPAVQEPEHRGLALRGHTGSERLKEGTEIRLRRLLQAGAQQIGLVEKSTGGEQLR